jgi:universal stress protein A
VIGKPAAEIKLLAEELKAGLIVIGSHGRHGLGMILGSTANGVLHGASCDVLAVRIKTPNPTK